jgi:hypothetical protein
MQAGAWDIVVVAEIPALCVPLPPQEKLTKLIAIKKMVKAPEYV